MSLSTFFVVKHHNAVRQRLKRPDKTMSSSLLTDPLMWVGSALCVVGAGAYVWMRVTARPASRTGSEAPVFPANDTDVDLPILAPSTDLLPVGSAPVPASPESAPPTQTVNLPGFSPDELPVAGRVRVLAGPHIGEIFALNEVRTMIGREATGGIRLGKDSSVSAQHAEITVLPEGRILFEDMSRNGSFVNGVKINGGKVEINGMFEVIVGGSRLQIEAAPIVEAAPVEDRLVLTSPDEAPGTLDRPVTRRPSKPTFIAAEFEQIAGPTVGKRFPIKGEFTTIGRENRDILLNDPTVSRQHAVLEVHEGRYLLRDMSSTHGTRVNGQEVDGDGRYLANGDKVAFGRSPEILLFRSLVD